ncbi:MAG: hypothetical protein LZF60_130025 [Nitrospira sp.]|nr:MAG: hypothetical protein LZF60_130025 [Nitrospira sp.]
MLLTPSVRQFRISTLRVDYLASSCKLPCQGDAAKENFELLIVSDTCQAGACQCVMRPFFVKLCNYLTILWVSPGHV